MKLPAGVANRAELVFAGTELLRGKLNSYPPLFARELSALGFCCAAEATVCDDEAAISRAISGALSRADLAIAVGGLGPTFDDLTRRAAAKACGKKLSLSPELLRVIKNRFVKCGKKMPPGNESQAFLLDGAEVLPNPNGTAPGQAIVLGKKLLLLLPGPLNEWRPMFEKYARPKIKKLFPAKKRLGFELKTAGIAEAVANEMLKPVLSAYKNLEFTILASPGEVSFSASGNPAEVRAAKVLCRKILGKAIYSEKGETLEAVVGRELKKRGLTLALAESCTGGLASHRLTEIPGSSDYFKGSAVTYSNESKIRLLGVSAETLKNHGAVSRECAVEMVRGAKKLFGADCALAITGIAGPGGATRKKPAGLVYIAVSMKGVDCAKEFRLAGGRSGIKQASASNALNFFLEKLKQLY